MTAESRIIGTYGARRADDLLEVLASPAARLCDLIELRLDLPGDVAPRIDEIVGAAPRPVLATCRAPSGLDAAGRTARLLRAVAAGAEWVDIEDDADPRDVDRLAATRVRIVRSSHVDRLPASDDEALALVERLLAPPASMAKLVALQGDARDALRILRLVDRYRGRLAAHIVPIRFTRPASGALGAPIVYAAIRAGTGLNLRLPTVRWMLDEAQFRRLAAGARPFLLLGANVEASVSPDILNAAFATTGPDLVSLRWSCDDPEPALRAILEFGWAGAAVTIPHKERALALVRGGLGRVAGTAERVGALNTVIREGDALVAHNTDLGGVLDAIAEHLPDEGIRGRNALILGAGGAARAAHAAIVELGARPYVFARTPERARAFAADVVTQPIAARELRPAVIISAIPLRDPHAAPPLDLSGLEPGTVVLDMVVSSEGTPVHFATDQPSVRRPTGYAMLYAQAVRQIALLGGRPPEGWGPRLAGSRALERASTDILLVGLRCTGKTSVAPLLADLIGRPWVDVDALVTERTGRTPGEMIRSGDEAAFRAVEAKIFEERVYPHGAVVATGGGAALHRREFAVRASWSFVVHLDARDDVLLARWAATPRAALTSLPPDAELARQRAERSSVYAQAADLTFDTSDAPPALVAERIADALETLDEPGYRRDLPVDSNGDAAGSA